MSTTAAASTPTTTTESGSNRPPRSDRWRAGPVLIRRLALVSLAANVLIVVTGAAVRLTGSGLGCPTWPKCTDTSYTNTAEFGVHGYIEFGNRLLSFVVGAAALATLIAVVRARHRRPTLVRGAGAVLAGVIVQGLIGGVTVRTGLNPWTVSLHFLGSVVVLWLGYRLWHRAGEGDGPARPLVSAPLRWLGLATVGAALGAIVVGTVVTGSGPHAGDRNAIRTGFDPALISQLHADFVFLLLGLTLAALLAFRAVDAPATVRRATLVLLGVELAQGLIGYVQYFTGLPVVLVGAHVLGACLLWVAAVRLLLTLRERPTVPATS